MRSRVNLTRVVSAVRPYRVPSRLQDIYRLMQLKDVLKTFTTFAVISAILLLGCQGERSQSAALTPTGARAVDLPQRFDDSLEKAFQRNPKQTAQRILRAHDGFSRAGPVTTESVKNYIHLEAAAARAQFLSDIMASDLNGDSLITPAEFAVLPRLPNGYKKARRLDGLFSHDKNQDGYISLAEAYDFASALKAARMKSDIAPIGSYLMLFDLNADGTVLRAEMTKALRDYVEGDEQPKTALRGAHVSP